MKLNKKVIESMTVATALAVMSTFTAFAGSTEDNTVDVAVIAATIGKNGTAGIISDLKRTSSVVFDESGLVTASIEKKQDDIVLASGVGAALGATLGDEGAHLGQEIEVVEREETSIADMPEAEPGTPATEVPAVDAEVPSTESVAVEPETPTVEAPAVEPVTPDAITPETEASQDNTETTLQAGVTVIGRPADNVEVAEAEAPVIENNEWSSRLMANVEEDMNIRTQPGEDTEVAGKLFRGDVAEVVSVGDGWTQITSGNVTGYVKNDFCVYGAEAEVLANEVCTTYATANTGGLRLRSEPSEEASIVTTAAEGDKLIVDKEAAPIEGWVAVKTSDATAYVSAQYVTVDLNLGKALTKEEIAAKEAKEKEAEEAKNAKKPSVSAGTDEVRLLAALIQCEAGNSSYEGMLAVGSVVMNRVRSGAYPGSISGVVYQAGQFPPALNGSVANIAAGGAKSSCMQAAQEAINGTDITNGALSFRSAGSGAAGTVIGGNVFF